MLATMPEEPAESINPSATSRQMAVETGIEYASGHRQHLSRVRIDEQEDRESHEPADQGAHLLEVSPVQNLHPNLPRCVRLPS